MDDSSDGTVAALVSRLCRETGLSQQEVAESLLAQARSEGRADVAEYLEGVLRRIRGRRES